MNFWGARPSTAQYIPKNGVPRPAWSYRGARRNAARELHWPGRYRFRRMMAALRRKIEQMAGKGSPLPA